MDRRPTAKAKGGNVTGAREPSTAERPMRHGLTLLAGLSAGIYVVITALSRHFHHGVAGTERPIIAVLMLLSTAFGLYLVAIRLVRRSPDSRRTMAIIIGAAVIYRAVLLFSLPIQEVDIYRYLWDGSVSRAGVSPFRYAPSEILAAESRTSSDEELRKLVQLRDDNAVPAQILQRVHYGDLPTVYPPTSQLVFAAAAWTSPVNASVFARIVTMKAWLVAFDLATIAVVIGLLHVCNQPATLVIIYAWCPLLLKEIANSGHLDAIAVFLTTLAVYLAAICVKRTVSESIASQRLWIWAITAALVLALAVGAKLYPIVLAPLLLAVVAKSCSWRAALSFAGVFVVTTWFVLWPLLPRCVTGVNEARPRFDMPLPASSPPPAAERDPSRGVAAFLRRWEMNDFIFLVLVENLEPRTGDAPDQVPWFTVVPNTMRQAFVTRIAATWNVRPQEVPFLAARLLTGLAFLFLAAWFAWHVLRKGGVERFCEAAFLTLAWFWLLCPTQNPWYWTWALPLLPFARGRAWLAVSGLTMLYYLRFWLAYHWPDAPVWGTPYCGGTFFDFVVTWIEFAPWLVWLAIDAWLGRAARGSLGISRFSQHNKKA